ncbi:MAG: FtsW/RodA/SpoVE family cell cycle protein [Rickettsiales bacterium]|nr:FtsW/RodA/SpoVE family cell cycle protein [Rickettsiales bacterium]
MFLILSCIFIFSSSVSVANRINVSNYYFFKHQVCFSILSICITIFLSLFNEHLLKKYSTFLFIVSFILLLLVPIMGFQTKGAKRWVYLLGISIQPTEILKPTLILFNAFLLEKFILYKQKKYLILSIVLYTICMFFVYKQPDIGTLMLITAVFFTQIFLLDFIDFKKILAIVPCFLILFALIYSTMPHVSNRINSFISSVKDPELANYQVKRSLIGYQNSGLFGRGFMEGEVKNFIPDVHTDFIFPAIAEEFGFIIVFLIICLYFYLSMRVLLKAVKINNNFFKILSLYGLSLLFLIQTVINIGVSLNLLPTKGMTLPFLSYGGSSMIGSSVTMGFILILTKHNYDTIIKTENIVDLSTV